jgi:ketosteroid isomerase-like protein
VATTTTEADVRTVIDDWADALRAKDAEGVVARQAPDFVQFALAPPLQATGLDRKGLEDWFSSWDGPIDYEIRDQRITAGEHVAFSHSLNRMKAKTTGGKRTELWFRQTLCFSRIGSEWKISHEHDSVPFYMDKDARAAIDLKPE